jgi:hypothetical protein
MPSAMSEPGKDLGENDANFADPISNVAEKMADSISHPLHPMIEQYAASQKNLASMTAGLYSRCMGGNSTIIAMAKWPGEFAHIQAWVLLNVVSGKIRDIRFHQRAGSRCSALCQAPSEAPVKRCHWLEHVFRESPRWCEPAHLGDPRQYPPRAGD